MTVLQLEFLKNLEYLTRLEIKDLLNGFTDIEVLLDIDDLELFDRL